MFAQVTPAVTSPTYSFLDVWPPKVSEIADIGSKIDFPTDLSLYVSSH